MQFDEHKTFRFIRKLFFNRFLKSSKFFDKLKLRIKLLIGKKYKINVIRQFYGYFEKTFFRKGEIY
jgi:hypothetical protein